MKMIHLLSAFLAHVPILCTDEDRCCTIKHEHSTSQAVFGRGSGGIEIALPSSEYPFNITGGEKIDFDFVVRDELDESTYSVYIGCGGCHEDDPILAPALPHMGYEGMLEFATQTYIYSIVPEKNRVFDTSHLANCTANSFTLRVVDHQGRPYSQPLVWAAVVGKGENFTPYEWFLFPYWILSNHGEWWSDLGWTFWLILFLGAPLLIGAWRQAITMCGGEALSSMGSRWIMRDGKSVYQVRDVHPREFLYDLAIWFLVAAAFEVTVHIIYAQSKGPVDFHLLLALTFALLAGQLLPLILTIIAWSTVFWVNSKDPLLNCLSNRWLGFAEVALALWMLFIFGGGFFLSGFAVLIASVLRLSEDTRFINYDYRWRDATYMAWVPMYASVDPQEKNAQIPALNLNEDKSRDSMRV